MKKLLALASVCIISHLLLPQYLTYLLVIFFIYTLLNDLYIIGEIKFSLGVIREGDIYIKQHIGKYSNIDFTSPSNIITKFKLDTKYEVNSFAIYYDDTKKVPEDKTRAVYGIMVQYPFKNQDLEEYLIKEGYTKKKLDNVSAIVARLPLVHPSTMMFAVIKYFKDLEKSFNDIEFCTKFRVEPKKVPGVIEVYRSNLSLVEFIVPLANEEQFLLSDSKAYEK